MKENVQSCVQYGERLMQLNIGAELFGNVIVQDSELTSKYHIGA